MKRHAYNWFWGFWHWSEESYRTKAILRDPLHGLSGNWNAWYQVRADDGALAAIAEVGANESSQRRFVAWLFWRWAREVDPTANRLLARFVVTQLAQLPPFQEWSAFTGFERHYGTHGISPIVLSQGSSGTAADVRTLEAVALPDYSFGHGPRLISEGFQAEQTELTSARHAVLRLFTTKNRLVLFCVWVISGHRERSRWLSWSLAAGWVVTLCLLWLLRFGPDPESQLSLCAGTVVLLWTSLLGVNCGEVVIEGSRFWSESRTWASLAESQRFWLRMRDGFTLQGGSAGLAFSLNIFRSIYRSYSLTRQRSRIWKRIFRSLNAKAHGWAATGVVSSNGTVSEVVLPPKIRACLLHRDVGNLLVPLQREGRKATVLSLTAALSGVSPDTSATHTLPAVRLGFAAEAPRLRVHRCSTLLGAVLKIAALTHYRRLASTVLLSAVSLLVLAGSSDLKDILLPPPAPLPIPSAISRPNMLTINLDTTSRRAFSAVLESDYWINRRVPIEPQNDPVFAMRAYLPLTRVSQPDPDNSDQGTVWIERRYRFLGRDFRAGERVGHYSVAYLTRLNR